MSAGEMSHLIGKVVTLEKGLVVTVIRRESDYSHIVRTDQGEEMEIINRVLRELPKTYRRDELPPY